MRNLFQTVTMNMLFKYCAVLCATAFILTACSSHIPPEIKQALQNSPSVAQVHQQAEAYMSRKVRWGGVILQTENRQNTSRLSIIAFPLSSKGEPQISDESPGRFIALVDEFLEPLVYSREREITIIGKLVKTETIKVGEYPYEYPVIEVEHYYLWPPRSEVDINDYPPYWMYDPWYRPYYPYYPWYPHRH